VLSGAGIDCSFKLRADTASAFSALAAPFLFKSKTSASRGFRDGFFAASVAGFRTAWAAFEASSAADTTFLGRPRFFTSSVDMLAEWDIEIAELCWMEKNGLRGHRARRATRAGEIHLFATPLPADRKKKAISSQTGSYIAAN